MAAIECMKIFALMNMQDSYFGAIVKWIGFAILLVISAYIINGIHQRQLQELSVSSALLKQKSLLVSKMHGEMLAISRTHLKILNASNEQQVRQDLHNLSQLISDHLLHYHQLQLIADESDVKLLNKFKIGVEKWYDYNENLLAYANVVSDTGFLKTLSMIDLAFSQIDSNPDDAILIVSQLNKSN